MVIWIRSQSSLVVRWGHLSVVPLAAEIMSGVILSSFGILFRSMIISLIIWCYIIYPVNCVQENGYRESPLAIRVLQQFRDEGSASKTKCDQDIDKILHGFTNHEFWSLRSELSCAVIGNYSFKFKSIDLQLWMPRETLDQVSSGALTSCWDRRWPVNRRWANSRWAYHTRSSPCIRFWGMWPSSLWRIKCFSWTSHQPIKSMCNSTFAHSSTSDCACLPHV